MFALGFALWTFFLNRESFQWYSVFPGIIAVLLGISVLGMLGNRELPPDERDALPEGAVRARTETAGERVATAVAVAASGGIDDRLEPGHQADVALRFMKLMQLGAYEAGIELADQNWLTCRVHSWLWNNRGQFGDDVTRLDALARDMLSRRADNETWNEFVAVESRQFADTWGALDFDKYGIAGNRRRVARDLDLVILAPVGDSGGYFVMSATAISGAFTILVRRVGDAWLVANHVGISPPVAEWPPIWWLPDDEVLEDSQEREDGRGAEGTAS